MRDTGSRSADIYWGFDISLLTLSLHRTGFLQLSAWLRVRQAFESQSTFSRHVLVYWKYASSIPALVAIAVDRLLRCSAHDFAGFLNDNSIVYGNFDSNSLYEAHKYIIYISIFYYNFCRLTRIYRFLLKMRKLYMPFPVRKRLVIDINLMLLIKRLFFLHNNFC